MPTRVRPRGGARRRRASRRRSPGARARRTPCRSPSACPTRATRRSRAPRQHRARARLHGPRPGTPLTDMRSTACSSGRAPTAGSRTCARRPPSPGAAARVVPAWVVPGSGLVKRAAEAEGLDRVFADAGFEWREPGCSMCVGMNGDLGRRRRAHRVDVQPELRGPPGPRRAHPPLEPGDGGRRGGDRARSPTCASCWGGLTWRPSPGSPRSRAHRPAQRRHRPHHPRALPAQAEGPGSSATSSTTCASTAGAERPEFVLNQPPYRDARILVAAANFACGSSREAAVWALGA